MQHHLSFDEGALHWIFTRSLELISRRNFIQRCLYRIYIIERLVMAGMSRITNLSLPSLVEVHRSFSRSRSIPQFLSPFFKTADTQLDSLYLWVDKFALRFQPCTCRHEVLVMQCQLSESKWKKIGNKFTFHQKKNIIYINSKIPWPHQEKPENCQICIRIQKH